MSGYAIGPKGEYANHPRQIPRPGWWSVLRRVKDELAADNVGILSAGVAFYAFLASFPALAAIVMVYGLIADPSDVQRQMDIARDLVPSAAFGILSDQAAKVAEQAKETLGFGLLISMALAIWSASKGIRSLLTAINVAYEETDERGFVAGYVWTLLFTVGAVLFAALSLLVIAAVPAAVAILAPDNVVGIAILWSRWLVMAVLAVCALGFLYHFGPSRRRAKFRWFTPGAVLATVLWILGSVGFSTYVRHFGSYNETFGSLGAVVVLLMWLYLSAYVVCVGAQVNAELEHQTRRDTTIGPSRPIGARGAFVADHVPREL